METTDAGVGGPLARSIRWILWLGIGLAWGACGQEPATPSTPNLPEECRDHPFEAAQTFETDPRVTSTLEMMTLSQKLHQMSDFQMGEELLATPDEPDLDIGGFRFRDGPRGVNLEDGAATCFPVPVARAATWNLELERQIGEAVGAEVRALGHNVILAPCVNTLRHPGWGRAQETYGEDPWFLGTMGTAYTRGAQEQVAACVKHYAGNNIEDTRMTNNALIEERNLHENYLRQFQMVIRDADPACVMSAYNKVNGAYCSENAYLLRDVLKGDWSFDGFVVSDWFATQSTIPSVLAGLDVEMPWPMNYDKLEQAVADGEVEESVIDEAVTRILRAKFKHGIAPLSEGLEGDPAVVEGDAHITLARDAARQAMVLLKNEDGALPLDRESLKTVAVVGAWANEARLGDNGSSKVTPSYSVSPFQGVAARAGDKVQVVTSADASAAEGADVAVVVAALSTYDEGESYNGGGDRDDLELSLEQQALIQDVSAMVETTVVVLEASGPITMEAWKDKAAAIVMAWYPGMEGGHALGDLLFGDANFSGRLPQTWPVRLEDEPEFGNQQDETTYLYLHGYRHFDHHDIAPLFPFGYGLSYTSFSYGELTVPCEAVTPGARLSVTVDIENTGSRAGVEVAQLYVSYEGSAVDRPRRELKGFARVALEAGEKKTVEISVRVSELAYYQPEEDEWVVEPIQYGIHVGPNARDLPLSGAFRVVPESESAANP